MPDNSPEINNVDPEEPILQPVTPVSPPLPKAKVIIILVLVVLLGSASGYVLKTKLNSPLGNPLANISGGQTNSGENQNGKAVGSCDSAVFKDIATGQLVKNDGKITDEGTHKLLRDGGESQSVYLTSSVVDLDQFLNKKVEVCGQTNSSKSAGWLMDVGRIKVL